MTLTSLPVLLFPLISLYSKNSAFGLFSYVAVLLSYYSKCSHKLIFSRQPVIKANSLFHYLFSPFEPHYHDENPHKNYETSSKSKMSICHPGIQHLCFVHIYRKYPFFIKSGFVSVNKVKHAFTNALSACIVLNC